DNDGDQDILAVFGGVYEGDTHARALYENPGNTNRWLTLRLEGVRSNRSGVGARIAVHLRTDAGPRTVHALAGTGGSLGSSTLQQEIGLGRARSVERVEIAWPSGVRQVVRGVRLNSVVRVREGEAEATPIAVQTLRLGGGRSTPAVASSDAVRQSRRSKQSRRRNGDAR
ncbi:MAG TPA: ASPIC/UnbV domain-containing protein, partial [Pyrinomonadaceae bacterium]|nr:ASPIC/UnbV domain-containing protein [Pyrinomonadaceae bacterium]